MKAFSFKLERNNPTFYEGTLFKSFLYDLYVFHYRNVCTIRSLYEIESFIRPKANPSTYPLEKVFKN